MGPKCICGESFILNANGKSCIKQSNYTAPSKCKEGNFLCKNGKQCINVTYLCDGDLDCNDGSDELPSPEGPCEITEKCDFKCDGNRCINKSVYIFSKHYLYIVLTKEIIILNIDLKFVMVNMIVLMNQMKVLLTVQFAIVP